MTGQGSGVRGGGDEAAQRQVVSLRRLSPSPAQPSPAAARRRAAPQEGLQGLCPCSSIKSMICVACISMSLS